MNTNILAFVSCIIVVIIASACDPDCPSSRRQYFDLEIPATITPAREAYTVGDTVTFSYEVGRTLFDQRSGATVTIADFNLNHVFAFRDVLGDVTNGVRASSIGEVISLTSADGIVIRGEGSTVERAVGKYSRGPDGTFTIAYQFVFRTPGLWYYTAGALDVTEFEEFPDISVADQCRRAQIYLYYKANEEETGTFRLLCENNEIYCAPGWEEENRNDAFDYASGYVFDVRE